MKINYHAGFYTVGSHTYTSKVAAILEAQKTNAEIKWHFFEDVFNNLNWLAEPLPSLDQLYKARALQIREKYDYVVVRVSGGADSTNVLMSFLNNGIHVDEIISEAPMSGLSNWDFNTKDTRAINTVSEFKYALMPFLHEISTKFPRVKITLLDSFKETITIAESDSVSGNIVNPFKSTDGNRFEQLFHLTDLAENGKRIAVVTGTDKPVLSVQPDGKMYNVFSDQPVAIPKPPFKTNYPNVDCVLFYWTPEMPELVLKMSHVVAREIVKPENAKIYQAMLDLPRRGQEANVNHDSDIVLDYILNKNKRGYDKYTQNKYQPFTIYERGIVPFIYPSTYKPDLFQVDKIDPNENFLSGPHEWVRILHGEMNSIQAKEHAFKSFYKNIKPEYLNSKKTGFRNHIKAYQIGTTASFKSQSSTG
jgi:hypothetical protein